MIIRNAMIHTMDRNDSGEHSPFIGTIVIDCGKIKEIVKGENTEMTSGEDIIDGTGKNVFPGFIDAHCHLGMWEDAIGFEGDDGNEATSPITPELRAIDGINPMDRTFVESYQGGVTTVATGPGSANVLGGQFAVIKTFGKRVDDMIVMEPAAMKCAFGENPKRVYAEKKQSPNTRMAIASELRNQLFKAKEYLKKVEEGKKDETKKPPFDIKMESLLPVLRKEIPLKAHAHRADDILTAIRIAKEFDVRLTLDHCTEGHLIPEIIKAEGLSAIVGPSFGDRSKFELKNLTFDTPGVLSKAGIKIAIMTDHPVVPLHYLPMMAALSAKAGLDPYEALAAITINPAEILGIDHLVGSITVGKDADLVLYEGHPFDLQSKVIHTIIDGVVVY